MPHQGGVSPIILPDPLESAQRFLGFMLTRERMRQDQEQLQIQKEHLKLAQGQFKLQQQEDQDRINKALLVLQLATAGAGALAPDQTVPVLAPGLRGLGTQIGEAQVGGGEAGRLLRTGLVEAGLGQAQVPTGQVFERTARTVATRPTPTSPSLLEEAQARDAARKAQDAARALTSEMRQLLKGFPDKLARFEAVSRAEALGIPAEIARTFLPPDEAEILENMKDRADLLKFEDLRTSDTVATAKLRQLGFPLPPTLELAPGATQTLLDYWEARQLELLGKRGESKDAAQKFVLQLAAKLMGTTMVPTFGPDPNTGELSLQSFQAKEVSPAEAVAQATEAAKRAGLDYVPPDLTELQWGQLLLFQKEADLGRSKGEINNVAVQSMQGGLLKSSDWVAIRNMLVFQEKEVEPKESKPNGKPKKPNGKPKK